MTIPTVKIHNVETGEIIEREMNDVELQQHETDQLAAKSKAQMAQIKAAEKAALLEKLGITADEAALLLS